ncbi:Hsp20/alpha crystallin family protein [Actinopolymorpha pittospori]|uniref:HSP20 family protein n=1 Tax=Actinopolymorpha pittospori TaxID=648752 RepID=A0A927MR54_9ACTN|nr:Hsp20/alpha crystallin family protein [Actinopolymorpha pittospori]MBE1604717.1 HSP20 family protein [Actinopolymorpha pittospori]
MLMRTDPFREFDRLTQQLLGTATRPAAMPLDAYRKDDWFYVHFDLPGVKPDDIELTVEQNVLTVRAERVGAHSDGVELIAAERPQGTFTRQLFLGETLDTDKLEADYDSGVLSIRIPVAEQAKPRRVQISGSGGRRQINP